MKEGAPSISLASIEAAEKLEKITADNWENSGIKKRWFNLQPGESFKAFVNGDPGKSIVFSIKDDGALTAEYSGQTFFYLGFADAFFGGEVKFITTKAASPKKPGVTNKERTNPDTKTSLQKSQDQKIPEPEYDEVEKNFEKTLISKGITQLPRTEAGLIAWAEVPNLIDFIIQLSNHKGWSASKIAERLSLFFNTKITRNQIIGVLNRSVNHKKKKSGKKRGEKTKGGKSRAKEQGSHAKLRKPKASRKTVKRTSPELIPYNAKQRTKKHMNLTKKKPGSRTESLQWKIIKAQGATEKSRRFFKDRVLDAKFNLALDELDNIAQKILKALHLPDKEEVLSDIKKYLDKNSDYATQCIFDSYIKGAEGAFERLQSTHRLKHPSKYRQSAFNGRLNFKILKQGDSENKIKQTLIVRLRRGYNNEHLNALRVIIWAFKEELAQKAGIPGEALELLYQVKEALEKYAKENGAEQIKIVMLEFKPWKNKAATYSYTYTLVDQL